MRNLFVAIAVVASLAATEAGAQSKPAQSQSQSQVPVVDSWVLALSWSPTFCNTRAGEKDLEQCGKGGRYGFIVHGLWPQFARGGKPKDCPVGTGVPRDVAEKMLPLMPSHQLIEHEWLKHGACTGLSPAAYFDKTRAAAEKIKVPPGFKPDKPQSMSVAQVEKAFGDANKGLGPDAVSVVCRKELASEVRICLDKDLKFQDCGGRVKDRCKADPKFEAVK
ncbi:MAG: ribonuclease T2 family protein [Actinomycetota bacterium]